MQKKNNHIIIVLLFICSLALISNAFVSFSNAQTNGETISVSTNLKFFEYSEIEGIKENISSLDIQLPEPNWTITNIQINFSDISLGSEIRIIEDAETGLDQVWNKNPTFRTFALGTQLEILELTELFGVYIKGYKTPEATEIIKFQIQGYDEGNYSPNNTIYRSIDLNISTSLNWYYQDFSSDSITLPIGNYSLVMNGTNLPEHNYAKYIWQENDLDPQIPNLYTSSYITSWSAGTVNTSFLCKLNQKIEETYLPTDLNMTAEFNGDDYVIPESGILEIANITYFSEETILNIPLKINKSVTLNFNYNYSINLLNEYSATSSAIIKESYNQWSLSPIISRISQNYFIRFNIPKNWYNFTIFRKLSSTWENVTSMVNIDLINRTINIPNNTIEENSEWRIIAYSPNFDFNLNFPIIEWEPGQELQFTVNLPVVDGNLTFNLINPIGFGLEEPIVKEVVSEETFFTYLIPSYSIEGTYTAKIFWNNATDIGFQSQEFQVILPPVPFTIDPIWIVISVILVIAIGTTSIFSYQKIKKYRNRKIEEARKLYDKCMDVLNLDYIIVSDKKSGLNVYQQKFTEKQIDATMISGFLQAIHSFGIELIKIEDTSQTIKLEYKDSIIIMTEFVNLRLILIMKEHPSSVFLYSLEDLTYDLYKYYGKLVEEFNGDIKPFKTIEKLLKHHLNTTITYPIILTKIDNLDKVKISQTERLYVNKAISFMKSNNSEHFFLSSLLPGKECSPKDIEIIINLIEKNIFQIF